MTALVRRIEGQLVLTLDESTIQGLSLAEGDALEVEMRDGAAVIRRTDADRDVRLQRGRAFIDRYRETFEALAK